MAKEYQQVLADEKLRQALLALVDLGFSEDLGGDLNSVRDWTSLATIPDKSLGRCEVRSRVDGVAAGIVTVPWILQALSPELSFQACTSDGQRFFAGDSLGSISGPVRDLLTAERLVLNIVSRLCGVAALTARYVAEIADTSARLYDTRKTTAGWRRLEKYAVRCGGGTNHRTGLFDGILIKDNHLALGGDGLKKLSGDEAIARAKRYISAQNISAQNISTQSNQENIPDIIEIEVDSLERFEEILIAGPDIILLDNFSLEDLSAAVLLRNSVNRQVELEASGGVTLDTIRNIALTGVDRISCGAITHQATWLDLGLDWIG